MPMSKVKALMSVAVSLTALVAALFVILRDAYPAVSSEWAYGTVGLILGYWLK